MFDIGTTDIYWKFPNNEDKYVITGVQTISNDLEVPLEILMAYSGEVTIKLDEMKNVNQPLYIIDKVAGESYNIINGVASLSLDSGVYTDRFFLSFETLQVLSSEDAVVSGAAGMFVDNTTREVVVSKSATITV